MQKTILKSMDAIIGRALSYLLPAASDNIPVYPPKSFLIIRPGGIGDAVLLIPAINELKRSFPFSVITVLAEKRNAAVFCLCPQIHSILCYDKPIDLKLAITQNFDCIIDTEQSHYLSACIARLTKSSRRIGFATNKRGKLFHDKIAYHQDRYEAFSFFDLLQPFDIKPPTIITGNFLNIDKKSVQNAEKLLKQLTTKQFITIFPGASIPERCWGADRYNELVKLLKQFGVTPVVIGGKNEYRSGEQIIQNSQALNLAGKTTLAETAAIIAASSLLVTSDSGMLHLAVGLDVPTVSLFGPGRHKKWAPQGEKHLVLRKDDMPCSPCTTFGWTPPCRYNVKCMEQITVDQVFNGIGIQLTSVANVLEHCKCKLDMIEVVK